MSVKFATQIFSKSVSASIHTAEDTAQFFMQINNTFDILNSTTLYDKNPNSRPLSEINNSLFDILKHTRDIFLEAKKVHKNTNIKSQPYCFTGIVWSINSILALYEIEKSDVLNKCDTKKPYFLMTIRLCQDPLENLFSIMRQKNGYNRNPTSRMFRSCYANICTFSLMKCSELCNCKDDNDVFLTVDVLSDVANNERTAIEHNEQVVDELENSSQIKKCLDFFNCKNCLIQLVKDNNAMHDKNQLLILNKMYRGVIHGGLKTPTDEIVKICKICLNYFEKNWESIKSKKGIVKTLMQLIPLSNIIPSFDSHPCKEHYLYIIRLLFITKIFHTCKQINEQSTKLIISTTKPHSNFCVLIVHLLKMKCNLINVENSKLSYFFKILLSRLIGYQIL
ncbi:Uncharacterized protein FWK35_00028340, partial [Aphis craccivora]